MSDQDWQTVEVKKRERTTKVSQFTSQQSLSSAKASGLVSSEKRFAAGSNKQNAQSANLRKIEESTDVFSVATVNKDLSKAIAQARNAKQWTQKQLATEICEPVQTVQSYENGTAVPNGQILVKLDRALGVRLPRQKK